MASVPIDIRILCPSSVSALLRRLSLVLPLLAVAFAVAPAAQGQSGLPVPRFVSLRSNEINLRTGPGLNYPVDWVYVRRHMPVEVVAEFDTWRKVRDWQGTEGWVHQSMLDGRRTGLVIGTIQYLRGEPKPDARTVARLEPGVIVGLQECEPVWCRVEIKDFEGWLERDAFWGVYPDETFED